MIDAAAGDPLACPVQHRTSHVPAPSCGRCGRPLSRYNDGNICAACSGRGSRSQPEERTGEIGSRLRRLRQQRGMSLTVLGGLCGVSGAYLSMVETGKRNLDRWSMIVALANALRVPPAELVLEAPADAPRSIEASTQREQPRQASPRRC